MFETVAIFEQIEIEKGRLDQEADCEKESIGPCWRKFQNERPLFVPSPATVGRLAALTQALRPYRYLQVEGAENGRCPADTASPTLDESYNRLLLTRINLNAQGNGTKVDADLAQTIVRDVYRSNRFTPIESSTSFIGELVSNLAGESSDLDASLNCGPSSPERGQLLVSLHAAGVDISAIQNGGGNFTYSDIPGANLSGIRLEGVSLNNSRLPGASFANANLEEVHFRGADLNGARFANARIANSDFEGARIQIFSSVGDAPWFFNPSSAENTLVSGIRLYESNASPTLLDRICLSLQLPTAFSLPDLRQGFAAGTSAEISFTDLSQHAVLIETRSERDELVSDQRAIIMFGIGLERTVLWERTRSGNRQQLEYIPLSECSS